MIGLRQLTKHLTYLHLCTHHKLSPHHTLYPELLLWLQHESYLVDTAVREGKTRVSKQVYVVRRWGREDRERREREKERVREAGGQGRRGRR